MKNRGRRDKSNSVYRQNLSILRLQKHAQNPLMSSEIAAELNTEDAYFFISCPAEMKTSSSSTAVFASFPDKATPR